mmetsp:Transcript_6122/g.17703  ORF Transcript_6122/g.17703 Transcript_6122/m.17703 type:complete len:106 (-) Transcript_6122:74-391(-)
MGAQHSQAQHVSQMMRAPVAAPEHPRLLGAPEAAGRHAHKETGMAHSTTPAGSKHPNSFLRDMASVMRDPATRRACAQAHLGYHPAEAETSEEQPTVSPSTLGRL